MECVDLIFVCRNGILSISELRNKGVLVYLRHMIFVRCLLQQLAGYTFRVDGFIIEADGTGQARFMPLRLELSSGELPRRSARAWETSSKRDLGEIAYNRWRPYSFASESVTTVVFR